MRPLAVVGAFSIALAMPGAAMAQSGFDGEGSGDATIELPEDGNTANVSINWDGLAAEIPDLSGTDFEELSNMPFPHAQHIHANGQGVCPGPERDEDNNGVVDTPEGEPDYGPVVTSLTEEGGLENGEFQGPDGTLDVENFPAGDSTDYNVEADLSDDAADEVRADNAVIVIHGLNPEIMPGETALEDSRLDDSFPLAATAPALCGELNEAGDGSFSADLQPVNVVADFDDADDQVDERPDAAPDAGGGATAGSNAVWMFSIGALALGGAVAVGIAVARRNGVSA